MLLVFKKLKMFFDGEENTTSSLMAKAMESAKMNSFDSPAFLSNDTAGSFDDLEDMMLQQQMDDQLLMDQQMRDMHDPYLNPGQDIVVDESYHGIDHGADHSFDSGGHHNDF